jgi:IS30 family transposase
MTILGLTMKAVEILRPHAHWIHTITADNGKEFADHKKIAQQIGIDFYFAKPYHSWERGANENIKVLIRQYFPKSSSFESINKYIQYVQHKLNNRLRKKYDFKLLLNFYY